MPRTHPRLLAAGITAALAGRGRAAVASDRRRPSMKMRRIVSAGTAALAGYAVLGMALPAAQASSAPIPDWTQQAPAAHPTARFAPAMAYDKATGTVVLFGGYAGSYPTGHYLGDTWTWNGRTWTRQHPAASPRARGDAVMTYDAATRSVVLFGGNGNHGQLGDTWTWNGRTWTRQHPAASPHARGLAAMTYDAASGTAVLFGGQVGLSGRALGDTWTWNGRTWTRQHPAASPPPG
jgi:hypothetical protein